MRHTIDTVTIGSSRGGAKVAKKSQSRKGKQHQKTPSPDPNLSSLPPPSVFGPSRPCTPEGYVGVDSSDHDPTPKVESEPTTLPIPKSNDAPSVVI